MKHFSRRTAYPASRPRATAPPGGIRNAGAARFGTGFIGGWAIEEVE
jgi:hypothetical protein